ncbi:hypothetical protein CCR75_002323 [Bremia lactucae]|uniref:Uncharacterized protein n=1 Tax=Bremia lactucae TaxID=4779 RepID=A0A976IKV7_BRELC|nr:hypothetical protein CCR75_002323 [Bremia lactucae]
MSVLSDQSEFGVAIYNVQTASLNMLQQPITDTSEQEKRLHTQFEVNHLIFSSRNATTYGMLELLKKLDDMHQTNRAIGIRKKGIIQSSENVVVRWYYSSCRADYNYWKGFEANEHVQIGAVDRIVNQLDDVETLFLSTVEQVALDRFMYID